MSIYDDVLECDRLFDELCVDHKTGEIDTEQERSLDELKEEIINQGIERLCKVRANKIADIDALKAEEKRITEKRKSLEKGLDGLESYIRLILNQSGKDKLDAGSFTVSTRKSIKTIIDDADMLPSKYNLEKAEKKPDLTAIKAAILGGIDVPGAHLQESFNLQIK